MAKRRGDNEGSIYKSTKRLKDGTTATYWHGEIYMGRDATGKKKVHRFSAATREEVVNWMTPLLADRQRGMLGDPARETVAQFLERWLSDSVRRDVKPRTFDSYSTIVKQHLTPELGEILLRALRPGHVRALYVKKEQAGLSPQTIHRLHAVLHRALEQAVEDGDIPRNVTDAVRPPKATKGKMETFTIEEARRFLEAAQEDRFHALYVLAVSTGMRQGELLGLTWRDIDLEAGRISVCRQLQYDRQAKEFTLVETKSGKSRSITLTRQAIDALRIHRKQQLEERLALGEAWDSRWNLVFGTQIGTPMNHGNLLRRSFYPLMKSARVPKIRFHDLRHTAATLLLVAGEHPKVVQEMLGHASITLTLDTYSHVVPSMQAAAASKMEAILGAATHKERAGA